MGQKSAQKLIEAIEKSKSKPWSRVLYGLGIRHVGSSIAQTVTEKFDSVEKLATAKVTDIEAIYGIGVEIAESTHKWFRVEANQTLIERLKNTGLQFVEAQPAASSNISKKLEGKTFVVTGTLPSLSRDEAKELIQKFAGKVSNSISKNTDYLVVGENAGSKLTKAEKLGIAQLSEEQLLEMVKQ